MKLQEQEEITPDGTLMLKDPKFDGYSERVQVVFLEISNSQSPTLQSDTGKTMKRRNTVISFTEGRSGLVEQC